MLYLDNTIRFIEDNNILEVNLCVMFSSIEVIDIIQVINILHLSIYVPIQYFSINNHKVDAYSWIVRDIFLEIKDLE